MSKLRGGTKYKYGSKANPSSADHLLYVSSEDSKAGKRSKLTSGEMALSKEVRSRAEVRDMDPFGQSIEAELRKEYGRINPSQRGKEQRAAGFKRVEKALGKKDSEGFHKINRLMKSDKTKQTVKFRKSEKTGTYTHTPKREVPKKMTRVDFSKVFYTPNTGRPQVPGNSMKRQLQTQPRKLHRATMEQGQGMKAIRAGGGKGQLYKNIRQRLKDLLS